MAIRQFKLGDQAVITYNYERDSRIQ